jgi:formate dehydrogenase subunit gamma
MQASAVKTESGYITRFNLRQRIEHIVLMVVFTVLVVTGLVQKFYTLEISQWAILGMGGIETTRWIHRGFAFLFTAGTIYHFAFNLYSVFIKHQKASMMPTRQDFASLVTELKHLMGLTKKTPRYGRFDFRQKFEYFGLMFGSCVIIITGFMLLFPAIVSRILPGQAIPVALEFHGWEATLAVLTILIWHIYDAVIRPDIFPTDKSIFTGKISLEREKEEHSIEYEEITGKKAD